MADGRDHFSVKRTGLKLGAVGTHTSAVTGATVIAGAGGRKSRERVPEPDPESIGIRSDIGARNPYALAERIYARDHPEENIHDDEGNSLLWSKKKPGYNRNLLNNILDCPYYLLFDPGYLVSPLFPSTVFARIGEIPGGIRTPDEKSFGKTVIDKMNPVIPQPFRKPVKPGRILRAMMKMETRELRQDNAVRMAIMGDMVQTEESPCDTDGDHWAVYKWGRLNKPGYYCLEGTTAEVLGSVVQGCSKSCYFLAALASNTWCKYPTANKFPGFIDTAYTGEDGNNPGEVKGEYLIRFYNTNLRQWLPAPVSSDLVVTSTGNDTVYSRPSTRHEVWHGIYEKAYGIFKGLAASALPYQGDPSYRAYPRPNIPSFTGGNPLLALRHITGGSYVQNGTYFQTIDIPAAQLFDKVNLNIEWDDAGTQGATVRPMVAWSYLSSAAACAAHGTEIAYSTEIIVANHSYSILGAVRSGGYNYVVLRNPYGRLWGADPDDPALAPYLYTGAWSPRADFTGDLTVTDGIFALRDDQFRLYFQAFGWIT